MRSDRRRKTMRRDSASRVRRAAARGVTLIELVIVVAILGLIAGGVAIGVLPSRKKAQIKTRADRVQHRPSARPRQWKAAHAERRVPDRRAAQHGEGPRHRRSRSRTPGATRSRSPATTTRSPCTSAGPDKKEGTEDDIRVPQADTAEASRRP